MRAEYRHMMEQIRLTGEEKERIMNSILERNSGKQHRRPTRLVLLAALVALMVTSATAVAVRSQGWVHTFDTAKEAKEAADRAAQESGASAAAWGVTTRNGSIPDYGDSEPIDMKALMAGYDTVLEHRTGGPRDGWSEMFTGQKEDGLNRERKTFYAADSLTGLEAVWPEELPALDFSWLESQFQPCPGCACCQRFELNGRVLSQSLFGEYRGENGAIFNLVLFHSPNGDDSDRYLCTSNRTEEYTTQDGAVVFIEEGHTNSGKQCFWVSYTFGPLSFSMYGNELPMDDLHALLDSLRLSNLAG